MSDPFAGVPALQAACHATVVIPARNEALRIAATLESLVVQRDIDGAPLAPGFFDVLVYANNCSDQTAAVVRDVAQRYPHIPLHVAEETLPPNVAHIGTARRAAMNAARARFAAAGRDDGILCATDADTVTASDWLAWTVREMRHVDAVTGRIIVDPAEWIRLPDTTRRMLREENAYHFAVARLRSQIDPRPYDPWPRHWQRSGPSFAVRLAAYDAAGGVPPVRCLEDIALYDALEAAGARIRHSLRVRVTTSARLDARAPGGFGERINAWSSSALDTRTLMVEDPEITVARLRGEPVGPPEMHAACVPAVEATAFLNQLTARGVSEALATRSSVASIAG